MGLAPRAQPILNYPPDYLLKYTPLSSLFTFSVVSMQLNQYNYSHAHIYKLNSKVESA